MSSFLGLQGSGADLINSIGGKGGGDVFFARMINMAFGILLNSSIKFNELDSLQRQPITQAEMISCDFSQACFWYTEGLEGYPWKWAPRLPEALNILSATNALALPRYPPFVFQYLEGVRGDRLVSTPIPCQSSTGILQFQFWRTSQIKLHVCTLDQFDDALQCDEVQASGHLSGYTTVSVPPSEQPQRIAIFAEGSGFVAIDDIAYSAELCTNRRRPVTQLPTAVDRTSPAPSTVDAHDPWAKLERRTGEAIASAEELICDTFRGDSEHACRWGTPTDAYWTVVTEPSIVIALGNLTVVDGEPTESDSLRGRIMRNTWPSIVSFADAPIGALVSDPIMCQKGEGQFIFKVLASPGVSVQVCAVSVPGGDEIQCGDRIDATSAGYPSIVDFEPIDQPFEIRIIPTYGSKAVDRFVVLDELAYFADICTNDAVPAVGEREVQLITGNPLDEVTLTSKTTTTTTTTIAPNTTTTAWTTISPLRRIDATVLPFNTPGLPFGGWFTQSTTQRPFRSTTNRIRPLTRPPIRPMTVRRIKTSGTISEFSPFRNMNTSPAPRRRGPTTLGPLRPPSERREIQENRRPDSMCKQLSCSFDQSYCGYQQGGFFGTSFWERRDSPMGRPLSRHTDIRMSPDTGSYLGVLLHRADDRSAILESPTFTITRLAYLRFDVYTATVGARVRVCFDTERESEFREYRARNFRRPRNTLRHCRQVFTEVNVDNARKWNTISALMIPGFEKFFIVVDHVSERNTYVAVGIDNIRVSPCDQ